jgi:hypothetical protein
VLGARGGSVEGVGTGVTLGEFWVPRGCIGDSAVADTENLVWISLRARALWQLTRIALGGTSGRP